MSTAVSVDTVRSSIVANGGRSGAFSTLEFSNAVIVLVLGDMNGDGALDNLDIAPFTLALTDPSAYAQQYPGIDANLVGDINRDSVLNNLDITPFGDLLVGGTAGW